MGELQRIGDRLSPWFATRVVDGRVETVTRQKVCLCGQAFEQSQLSERVMTIFERAGAVDATMRMLPDLFVPLNCPPCESRALGYARPEPTSAPVPAMRRRMEDRERFARNLGRLCAAWNKPMDTETSETYWYSLERTLTDDEFERGVLAAIGGEKKWPVPAVVAAYGRAA